MCCLAWTPTPLPQTLAAGWNSTAQLQGGDQHIVLAGAGAEITFDAANTPDPLAVGTTEHFIGDYLAQNPGVTVDYIHGAAVPAPWLQTPTNQPQPC